VRRRAGSNCDGRQHRGGPQVQSTRREKTLPFHALPCIDHAKYPLAFLLQNNSSRPMTARC
jgi:hypothetical protein